MIDANIDSRDLDAVKADNKRRWNNYYIRPLKAVYFGLCLILTTASLYGIVTMLIRRAG